MLNDRTYTSVQADLLRWSSPYAKQSINDHPTIYQTVVYPETIANQS